MKCVTQGHTHTTSKVCGVLLNGEIKNDAELTEVFFEIVFGRIYEENTTSTARCV